MAIHLPKGTSLCALHKNAKAIGGSIEYRHYQLFLVTCNGTRILLLDDETKVH